MSTLASPTRSVPLPFTLPQTTAPRERPLTAHPPHSRSFRRRLAQTMDWGA